MHILEKKKYECFRLQFQEMELHISREKYLGHEILKQYKREDILNYLLH